MFSSINWQPADYQSDCYSHYQIRSAQPEDLTNIAEILADSFYSQNGIFGWAYPLLRLGIYEDLRTRLRSTASHHICLVAIKHTVTTDTANCFRRDGNNELAGTVEMSLRLPDFWSSSRSRYPYISNLAVQPTHRRQGVAGQLLLSCEQVALSWGFHDLYLHVLENNHKARQLYFKQGYSVQQVQPYWGAWLLKQPRQIFLHKCLNATAAH